MLPGSSPHTVDGQDMLQLEAFRLARGVPSKPTTPTHLEDVCSSRWNKATTDARRLRDKGCLPLGGYIQVGHVHVFPFPANSFPVSKPSLLLATCPYPPLLTVPMSQQLPASTPPPPTSCPTPSSPPKTLPSCPIGRSPASSKDARATYSTHSLDQADVPYERGVVAEQEVQSRERSMAASEPHRPREAVEDVYARTGIEEMSEEGEGGEDEASEADCPGFVTCRCM